MAAASRPHAPATDLLGALEKLCLAEFLSCHAMTLLAGTAMATKMSGGSAEYAQVFWGLIVFYALMAGAAFLMHRSHMALLGFYMTLAARAFSVASLHSPDEDMMRAEVLKNMTMFPAMMLLIAGIAFTERPEEVPGDQGLLQQDSGGGFSGLLRKIRSGRTILFVVSYYLLWVVVTWTWPFRVEQ